MILSIDLGNSRLKWQLSDAGRMIGAEQIAPEVLEPGLRSIPWPTVDAVRICSVASEELTQAVSVICDSLSHSECGVSQVTLDRLPSWFSLASTDPQQIGRDRVMAMLGAFKARTHYAVIDAGTAVTIDYVSDGAHAGGFIAPGLSLARNSLTSSTAGIGAVQPQLYSAALEPGRNTQRAVEHGVRRGLVALVQDAVQNAPIGLDRVVITGGDAEWLRGHLTREVDYQPYLVFSGMARYFASMS